MTELDPVRTCSLTDDYAGGVLTFVSNPDGTGYALVSFGDPDDAEKRPYFRARFELDDEGYAYLVDQVAGHAAARHAAEEAATDAVHQAAEARREAHNRTRVFALHTVVGNRNGDTATVHVKTCPVVADDSLRTFHDSAEVAKYLRPRFEGVRTAVANRERIATPSTVQGGNWMPFKFCGRCKPLGDATAPVTQRWDDLAYLSGYRNPEDVDSLVEYTTLRLWETEQELLRAAGVIS